MQSQVWMLNGHTRGRHSSPPNARRKPGGNRGSEEGASAAAVGTTMRTKTDNLSRSATLLQ
jgi:hypothetical protein